MMYLIYPTLQDALNSRSFEVCLSGDCINNVTIYTLSCIENQTNLEGAMVVPEDQEYLLTPEQFAQLENEQFMLDNGWSERELTNYY